ncbi:MAG: helix-turn-helix domain-containing protein [archaeon]
MISQQTLDALKSIGLNLYERKLYASLLARGTSTAGELSEMATVPRSRSYDVLESLADKGYVVVQHSKPLRYVAIAPAEAMERAKNRLREKMDVGVERIDQFKTSPALDELALLYSAGVSLVDSADLSGALKGRYALHQQVETMLKNATKSVDIITTANGLKELYTQHSGLIQSAIDKGVKIRIAAPVTDENREAAKALGAVVKIKELSASDKAQIPDGRMFLSDETEVVIALTDDKTTHSSQDVSFWTSSDHFSEKFAKPIFNLVWKHA